MMSNIATKQRGFSLLELMVAIFIIGLMVGIVGINIAHFDPESELQDFGEEVFAQLRYGSDQALFDGEHIGLVPEAINEGSEDIRWQLSWHRWRDRQWQALEDLPAITPPEFVRLSIEVDQEPVDLWQWLDFEEPLPTIIFYGGGEALAATLIFELDDESARDVDEYERRYVHMDINELGNVVWRERSDDALANGTQ